MESWGKTLMFLGVGSMLLTYTSFEFMFLSWIDNWGEQIGWAIRAAITALGAGMWFIGRQKSA
jgi:hypothetical protein